MIKFSELAGSTAAEPESTISQQPERSSHVITRSVPHRSKRPAVSPEGTADMISANHPSLSKKFKFIKDRIDEQIERKRIGMTNCTHGCFL